MDGMDRSRNPSESIAEHVRDTLGRSGRQGNITGAAVRSAAMIAVRGTRSVGRGASNLAREAVEGALLAVGEVSGETTGFVRDAVIGVVEGTGQVITVTTPAIREAVIGAVRGSNAESKDVSDIGRDAVEGAIVGAKSIGIDSVDAASAAVNGAVEAMQEAGGDLRATANATVGGVISGVSAAGGDVVAATRETADLLVTRAAATEKTDSEIAGAAGSAIDAAIQAADQSSSDANEIIAAAATGAVEAAYRIGQSQGDTVRRSVVRRLIEPGMGVAPELERRLAEIGGKLSEELPKGRAAWRGRAMFSAGRSMFTAGGIDLAGSLAYFTIMSFFPLVALVIMLFALFSDPQSIRDGLTDTLVYYFPASTDLIGEAIEHLIGGSAAVGVIAAIGMLIGANGLFMAANRAINRIFETESRKTVGTTVAQAAISTIIVVLFMLSVGLTALFQVAISFGGGIIESVGSASTVFVFTSGVISAALPAFLTAAVFTVVYYHLPNIRVAWRDAAFGGMIAVILFESAKHIFFWFTGIATQRSVVYGPIASFVVLLMWAYVAGMIFLYGAALTKAAAGLRPNTERPNYR